MKDLPVAPLREGGAPPGIRDTEGGPPIPC